MDLKEIGTNKRDWIDLAQEGCQISGRLPEWPGFMN